MEHFASLWERLFNLYLNEDQFEDISAARENEFLSLEGTIMEELAAVAEFEEGRFALVDEVTSVINEAVSLRHLKEQSDFQVRRRKERSRQVLDLVGKVNKFVAERDTTTAKKEKELEVRLSRPFWDPEKGKFGVILGRIVASPARFFSAIRLAGQARKANSFLLALLSILMMGCVITVAAFNAQTARMISYNFCLESGIVTSDGNLGAKVLIWVFVAVGAVILSLAAAISAAILAQVLTLLMHIGFKLAGAKGDMVASHKVVSFGLAPLLLLVLIPTLSYLVKTADLSASVVVVLPVLVVCCTALLQIVGVNKIHGTSPAASTVGWLVGMVLFAAVTFGGLWVWHYSLDVLPPLSGKYVYVTAKETEMVGEQEAARRVRKGQVFKFVDEKGNFYTVRSGKDEGRIRKKDAKLREGSVWSLPGFLVESSFGRIEALVDRLSREIKKEARGG